MSRKCIRLLLLLFCPVRDGRSEVPPFGEAPQQRPPAPDAYKYSRQSPCQMATRFHIVVKPCKYALKQAPFVGQRFVDQLVADVTSLTLDTGIKRDALDQFKAHLTGKLVHIGVLSSRRAMFIETETGIISNVQAQNSLTEKREPLRLPHSFVCDRLNTGINKEAPPATVICRGRCCAGFQMESGIKADTLRRSGSLWKGSSHLPL